MRVGLQFVLVGILLRSSLVAQAVRYRVSLLDPTTRLFHVEADFPVAEETLFVALPAWSPGNYEIQNYARYLRHFSARDQDAHALSWSRVDKSTWMILTGRSPSVTVAFDALADSLDLSMARIYETFAQFLGTNLFLYEPGHLERPAEVRFSLPQGWQVATALTAGANGAYTAANYDLLADAETFLGHFGLDSIQVGGKWIRIAVWPVTDYPPTLAAGMRQSVARIATTQDKLMGGAPYNAYTIFIMRDTVSWAAGLEHVASQFDVVPAGPMLVDDKGNLSPFINALLAHEFFHLWNVKRIRPAEMWPYDYRHEQYTPLLWWSEGVTDYYADLTNWRAGLESDSEFIHHVYQNIEMVGQLPEPWSEEDGSLATWIDEVYDNSSQLYYPKGSLTGLLLDISIRDATDNTHSLDDVMRTLLTRFYEGGKGFSTADLLAVLRENGMRDVDQFRQQYIHGRDSLPYGPLLAKAGLDYEVHHLMLPTLGMMTAGNHSVLTGVVPGSAAEEAGLQVGDTLRSVGKLRVTAKKDFTSAFEARYRGQAGAHIDIVIQRGGHEVIAHATIREHPVAVITLTRMPNPTSKQARIWRGLATGTTDRAGGIQNR